MKDNKKKLIIFIIIILICVGVGGCLLLVKDKDKGNTEQDNQIKEEEKNTDKKNIVVKKELSFEINTDLKIKDIIEKDNGIEVVNKDEDINTSSLGEQTITLKYKDEEEKELKVTINIIDTEPPIIEYKEELSTKVNKKIDLLKNVTATDNSKEEIKVKVDGDYDFKKEGTYNLKYVAEDSSGNKTEKDFILKVEKENTTSTNTTNTSTNNSKPTNNTTNNNSNSNSNSNSSANTNNASNEKELGKYIPNVTITNNNGSSFTAKWDPIPGVDKYVISLDEKLYTTTDTTITINGLNEFDMHAGYFFSVSGIKVINEDREAGTGTYSETITIPLNETNYVNEIFRLINNSRGNKLIREPKLDAAALAYAKYKYEDTKNNTDTNIGLYKCIEQSGFLDNQKMFYYIDVTHNSSLIVEGKFDKIIYSTPQNFFDRNKTSLSNNMNHVGVAYYKNVVVVVFAMMCNEIDTSGMNTDACK